MGWCTFLLVISAIFGLAGWATAFIWLARARRYYEAFERAFALARRLPTITDSEKAQFARIIGEAVENDPKVS